jgi:hypothetical protein
MEERLAYVSQSVDFEFPLLLPVLAKVFREEWCLLGCYAVWLL